MNQSETAFVLGGGGTRFDVRYYTPGEEIPLAGHPTIATTAALADARRLVPTGARTEVTFVLRDGPISIGYETPVTGLPRVVMTQRRPEFLQTLDRAAIAPVFGLKAADLRNDAPVQVVSTGTRQLMIPVATTDALRRSRLDVPAYEALRAREKFFSVHLFVLEGATPRGRTFARHFGVPPDQTEDPVTGSATGGMGAYLFHHRLVSEHDFVAVILPETDTRLLTREVLYTAVTRTRRSVVLVSDREIVDLAIGRRMERFSGLADRLASGA